MNKERGISQLTLLCEKIKRSKRLIGNDFQAVGDEHSGSIRLTGSLILFFILTK